MSTGSGSWRATREGHRGAPQGGYPKTMRKREREKQITHVSDHSEGYYSSFRKFADELGKSIKRTKQWPKEAIIHTKRKNKKQK